MQNLIYKSKFGITKLRNYGARHILMIAVAVPVLTFVSYNTALFWPKKINYNYGASQTCFFNPVFAPGVFKNQSQNYDLTRQGQIKLFGRTIFAKSTCVSLKSMQSSQEQIALNAFDSKILTQKIKVQLPSPPSLNLAKSYDQPTSTKEKLRMVLSQPDNTFDYIITGNSRLADCQKSATEVSCDLQKLNLGQSQNYELKINRRLNEQVLGAVQKLTIKTVEPIFVTGTSIAAGSMVYDVPKQLEITLNKPVSKINKLSLINAADNSEIKTEAKISEAKIILLFSQPLPRETTIKLSLEDAQSADEAYLNEPFMMSFSTSGGPKVLSSNIAAYGENIYKTFVINFDSPLSANQNPNNFLAVASGGTPLAFNASIEGNKIYVKVSTALGACSGFSLNLKPGLVSAYGVTASKGYSANSRTLCQQIFSIGASAGGRAINAYKFGNGANKILYVGATHGDEFSSKYTLDSWINELEANAPNIPADKTIYVVPLLNPDGFANRSRVNGRNVDLNRNFPSNTWKSDVVMPGGNLLVGGGGASSLSEPESAAIANFILAQRPYLVLTYHSKGSMAVANEVGNSLAMAQAYGSLANYWALGDSALGSTFAYDTTGAMENWLADKVGIPAILIELSSHNYNEFSRNKNAMWRMIK